MIGFDTNLRHVKLLQQGIDPAGQLKRNASDNKDIIFTHDVAELREDRFFVVAVPTPVDVYKVS